MAHTPPPRKAQARPPIVIQAQAQPTSPAPSVPEPAKKRLTLAEAGFIAPALIIKSDERPYHHLMLSLEGPQGSGKSEFADSAPGPIAHLVLDRAIDSILDNPEPPPTRSPDVLYKVVKVPKASQFAVRDNNNPYLEYWRAFQRDLFQAIDSLDARTVVIDGDPDSWELQRLAEFGRLTKVPPLMYDGVNAARRQLYSRCYDSGKIVIATARVRQVWSDKVDANGRPVLKEDGTPVREWNGEYLKQGFQDGGHVWTVRCLNIYDKEKEQFGIRIIESKVYKKVEGQELWGADCCFEGLVSLVYPNVTSADWGF